MHIYKIDKISDTIPIEELPTGPIRGQVKIKLETGVAVLTSFDQEAIWVDSNTATNNVATLNYTDSIDLQAPQIEHGLPVDENLTISQLQSICTQLSLSIEGTQQELIDRIKQHLGIG